MRQKVCKIFVVILVRHYISYLISCVQSSIFKNVHVRVFIDGNILINDKRLQNRVRHDTPNW